MHKAIISRFLLVFLFFSIGYIYAIAQTNSNQPNILLIIADDLGVDASNGYQDSDLLPNTPNLDALRASGLTFMNVWAAPKCTPTRATIMSGKYGVNTGVLGTPGNLEAATHTSIFKELATRTNNAYADALIGKWHLSQPADYTDPTQHGIDYYEGNFKSGVDDYYNWEKITNGVASMETTYATTHLTDKAINWVNNQNKPWFLWLAHIAPHTPYHVPPSGLFTSSSTNTNQQKYIAMIEAMDSEIGRLLQNIPRNVLDNTIIIYIGDNGTQGQVLQNFPNGHGKATLYQGGIHVPMIVAGTGVQRKNEQENALVHSADIYATILEVAGSELQGGIYNSLSFDHLLTSSSGASRPYNYSELASNQVSGWTIRDAQYKLIEFTNGSQEFYDLTTDPLETTNLINDLSASQQTVKDALISEANQIRNGWSCNDLILNGDETSIDSCSEDNGNDGGGSGPPPSTSECDNDNSTSTTNIGCCSGTRFPNAYFESVSNGIRKVYSNSYPNHDFCFRQGAEPEPSYYQFDIDATPQKASNVSSVVNDNGRPGMHFGVALNGVIMAPAPAQPFIFENPNTGEFNWDWVFEPTNNQGQGQGKVSLDCASAHTGPQGYHYHGNMFEYVETIQPGISISNTAPSIPLHIGWAADGFPILYRFGPNANGDLTLLQPSYRLKAGDRPGDGITEPCGPYNGKYTKDYEYVATTGDLDECNGIERNITITTLNGDETFSYFYIITDAFPQIPRCVVGTPSAGFSGANTGMIIDNDNDGFISEIDCDDNNASINPNTPEILDNSVDENCDGIIGVTQKIDNDQDGFDVDSDCDDNNPAINPNAVEVPNNNVDEDCDGTSLVIDNDQDGFNSDSDCDDNNPAINPNAVEIPNNNVDENCDGTSLVIDNDQDGFNSDSDCDDNNPAINPNAVEIPNNNVDENCDGTSLVIDNDQDGFNSDSDCDDNNPNINPNAVEVPNNNVDENCDGTSLVIDNDQDGFNSDSDCDDNNPNINPNAVEVPNNNVDENCDGTSLVIDNDQDGFNSDSDCDDNNPAINPNAVEIPNNNVDENCDGTSLVIDNDQDGFNSDSDCDDNNPNINPNAVEIPNNNVDENCDGTSLVIDNDQDGFNSDSDCDDNNPNINPNAVEVPNNNVDENCDGTSLVIDNDQDGFNSDSDCDDNNPNINPNAVEVPNNNVDENCDGTSLVIDNDQDGFNSDSDCDDNNPNINPNAVEVPNNNVDENCDGTSLVIDNDQDGFNSDSDCDDNNPAINPNAVEIPNNNVDENCDGTSLVIDNDQDGFNSDSDCDDNNPAINPNAVEIPNNNVDENCDGTSLVIDNDQDGFNSDSDCDDNNPNINPNAVEVPNNNVDENCDGTSLVIDNDQDGFNSDSDCDDNNPNINPNAVEVPNNNVDENCDGTSLVIDNDQDGFNSDSDCDDNNPAINPNAVEIPNNNVDENCDGTSLVIDNDQDGFNSDSDCDDNNPNINPNAVEVPNNNVDENCDGTSLVIDNDQDGFNSDSDCDDNNPNINPNAVEVPNNNVDEDCDGADAITSSVKDLSYFALTIYPNPVSDLLVLNFKEGLKNNLSLSLFDNSGKLILQKQLDRGATINTLDVTTIDNGAYILQLNDDMSISRKKILIIHP